MVTAVGFLKNAKRTKRLIYSIFSLSFRVHYIRRFIFFPFILFSFLWHAFFMALRSLRMKVEKRNNENKLYVIHSHWILCRTLCIYTSTLLVGSLQLRCFFFHSLLLLPLPRFLLKRHYIIVCVIFFSLFFIRFFCDSICFESSNIITGGGIFTAMKAQVKRKINGDAVAIKAFCIYVTRFLSLFHGRQSKKK